MDACFSQYPSATAKHTRNQTISPITETAQLEPARRMLGGEGGARGEVEIPTEEHEDEPEPDGRRGHRPVVSDGHRGRRRRCRNSDLRLWIQLPASAEAEKGMAKVLTGGGCLEAAAKAERLGPSAAAESGAARGGPVAMVSRDGPAGSRPRWAGWEEAGVQLSRGGSGLGSLG
ncbi:hypothetical protein [Oryza sativa Japonica Group]|uniref:Uncharacterized protein n=1 Tax=Oryza sativa subsp. japonica TaxID=39947 RepID=A3A007_ORYSJ|nr:hypothetical protein OsJ_04230 [Oryza sativa Japonica Group]BAD81712.1 hypothetical protein [Oryza sativa Japonica Group]BAD82017.1 hypothetical protein [Oryza sativa Japonica Group]